MKNNTRNVKLAELGDLTNDQIAVLALSGYLFWNATKARKDALDGVEVPGVTIYKETSISAPAVSPSHA